MTNLPDAAEYPKLRIGEQEFEVKYTCEDIIRLKRDGVCDVFERNPAPRKLIRRVADAQSEVRRLLSQEPIDQGLLAAAQDALGDAQDAMEEASAGWTHPLDRMDVEMRFVLLAYGLTHVQGAAEKLVMIDRGLELSRQVPFAEFIAVHNAVSVAILKASAQTTQATA